MSETLEQRIEELYEKIRFLRAEKDDLNKKARVWAEKRDRIHGEIRNLRSQIQSLREKRDALNEKVKRLKSLRNAGLDRRNKILEEIKKLREEKNRREKEKPSRSRSSLESEIEKIEWKIQTEPLPLDVERELIDRVKTLEAQMEVYRRIENIRIRIADLKREADRLKRDTLSYRSRIREIATQSQELHMKMLKKIEDARKLKLEADEMHQRYLENKEKAKAISLEIKKILDEIRSIQNFLRAKEEKERMQKQEDIKKKAEERALEKFRRGEKLTFDEFKILLEKGLI